MTPDEARTLEAKFERYRAPAAKAGDGALGAKLFGDTCARGHRVGGSGGPPLDGVGLKRPEGILRAVLTPGAGVESGYRVMRVTLNEAACSTDSPPRKARSPSSCGAWTRRTFGSRAALR